ncbi:MAG: hypothetical protein DMG30_24525 [Acidobacteria bacterium]|nr:MAG: hypothetical protein DMG30_24525 [Acidobacteriota bacterium]
MTILARILCFVCIVVLAFVIFSKPREITLTEPQVQPQAEQVSKPPPPSRPSTRPKPQPSAEPTTFELENHEPGQPIFRPLQPQPKPAQTQRVRKAPTVYEWEETFNAAMMETDRSKRQERIDVAQTAINRRIEEIKLNAGDGSPEESAAIRNAQLGLNLLREEVSSNNGQSRR